jgi:hypothetical protein
MRPGARTASVNDPLIKKVIRLLSQLNDPRVDLEDYKARFLQGLYPVFGNGYTILVLVDENGEMQARREFISTDLTKVISDDVQFTKGVLYTSYENLKFI